MFISKPLIHSTISQDKRLRDSEMWKDKPNISYKHITNQWEVLRRVCCDVTLIFIILLQQNGSINLLVTSGLPQFYQMEFRIGCQYKRFW